MSKGAIRDNNPVVFLEHKRLYSVKGPQPTAEQEVIPIGRARIARAGRDLTLVSIGKGVADSLEAAERLSADGIEVEVVDLRTLRPLDMQTVLESAAHTQSGPRGRRGTTHGGWAAGVLGLVAEEGLARPR